MCRWIAYRGRPVFLEDIVSVPEHSLVHQSLHAREAKTVTNGDGFGLGWYGERDEPGIFRDIRPAWSDENLKAIARNVRAGTFFAHVRASTGTASTRANCHPFSHGRWMFMHNGQIGGYERLKRGIENLIPDTYYGSRHGTTDTEALFLIAMACAAEGCPVEGMAETLGVVAAMMREAGIAEPLRFAAALTDGRDLYAFRWSTDAHAPTVYWCESRDGDLLVVSEPIDESKERWRPVPAGRVLIAKAGEPVTIATFAPGLRKVASTAAKVA
jgi:predicted glutamine amidotransferase